ncbi:MAG: hypothetical protein KC431_27225 [Myxococcales bacterium]|nr:hypothetical protein [Myxococcales bacterium]
MIERENDHIKLSAAIIDDELCLSYAGHDLGDYAGLHVGRDPGQTVVFEITDFETGGQCWMVDAKPRLLEPEQCWMRDTNSTRDTINQYLSTEVEIEVEVRSGEAKRKRRVRIKTTPKEGMPDPRLSGM